MTLRTLHRGFSTIARRPAFAAVLILGIFAAPLAAEAQPAGKVWRIGWVNITGVPPPESFIRGLTDLGWLEGKNIVFEYRYVSSPAGVQQAAEELVRTRVDIIVSVSAANAEQILKATKTIPVVVLAAGELGSSGLVASLRRPSGNLTGMQIYSPELMGKRLQLLKEILPGVSRLVILRPGPLPVGMVNTYLQMTDEAAGKLGIRTRYVVFETPATLSGLFSGMGRERDEALLVWAHPFTRVHSHQILDLAMKHRLPVIGEIRLFAEHGSLFAYGPKMDEVYRQAATYVDKVLRGANPGDLPIGQATEFELIINLKTAKALGLTIPQSLLLRADQVIQ
ncbi:MAG TPA: ABC transporter substrate-binding protein [Terriglobales bacterium]|nr:ABC transporter substrate-binding protein [Terriglobales bacterium]